MHRKIKTFVFLDVDGVLSIPTVADVDERKERWPMIGVCWPIPMADMLLRAIEADPDLIPIWMTTWGERAWQWNDRAGTSRWPVGYPLTKRQQTWALRRFPECACMDGKFLSVRWCMRRAPHNSVVWIEDGFGREVEAWAACTPRVRLVDTWPMEGDAATFLLQAHTDPEEAARDFLNRYCLGSACIR